MRIAICDDEQMYINLIKKRIIEGLGEDTDLDLRFFEYTHGKDLLSDQLLNPFDVVFLDINMPDIDGRDIAKCLRKLSFELMLVFFSSEDSYVFDSFETSPVGYIRKAKMQEDVAKVCKVIKKKYNDYNEKMIVGEGEDSCELYPMKVWYFESKRRYLLAYYGEGKFVKVKCSIREMSKKLENKGFIRIDKSYLSNYRYMYSLEKCEVLFVDMHTRLPMSKNRAKEIRSTYFEWVGGRR